MVSCWWVRRRLRLKVLTSLRSDIQRADQVACAVPRVRAVQNRWIGIMQDEAREISCLVNRSKIGGTRKNCRAEL